MFWIPFLLVWNLSAFLFRSRDFKPEWTRQVKVIGWHFALPRLLILPFCLNQESPMFFIAFDMTLTQSSTFSIIFSKWTLLGFFSRVKRSLSSCRRTWWRFLTNSIRWGYLSFCHKPLLILSFSSSLFRLPFYSVISARLCNRSSCRSHFYHPIDTRAAHPVTALPSSSPSCDRSTAQLQQSHPSFICSFCHFLLLSHCLRTEPHKCNGFSFAWHEMVWKLQNDI